jgi:hypothetical protein
MLQESCSVAPTDSHIADSTTIEHESWLLQEVLRDLSHCLRRSIPQPESGITYGVKHFQLNASAENCLQVVFHAVMFTAVSVQGLGVEWKMSSSNLSETKYSFSYTYLNILCLYTIYYSM